MTHRLLKVAAGLVLLAMLNAPARAADRHFLDTQVPGAAAQLPMLERLPATNRLHLAIGLPLRNRNVLTNLFRQMYDGRSTNFHRWLTPGQFAEQFGPAQKDYQTVMDFAQSNGLAVTGTYGNRALLEVSGKVADIERTFQMHLGTHQHPTENRRFYAPDAPPSVDASLPVLYVSGLDDYARPHPSSLHITPGNRAGLPRNGTATNGDYIGYDFRNAYVPGTSLTGAGQVVGLFEYGGYTPSDIQQYEANAGLPAVRLVNVLKNLSSNAPLSTVGEVSLDIEMVISMAPGLAAVNVYEGPIAGSSDSIVMNEIASPTESETLPRQISSSYGWDGDTNVEQALIEMAVQGQSVLFASGDNGAFDPSGKDSSSSIDYNYMTGVGGTELVTTNSQPGNVAGWSSERVWNNSGGAPSDASSGGILTTVPIPGFQAAINMSQNHGSTVNRNIPDVSMVADGFYVMTTDLFTNGTPPLPGQVGNSQGTSGAAPLWAGFIALANQQGAAEGKPPIGFLNPALYEIGQSSLYSLAFHDITVGNDTNTNSAGLYFATPGYDLCTGWGSPNGTNLINALVAIASPCFVNFNYAGSFQNGSYYTPFNTLAKGTSAVSNYGTIFIINGGSTTETPVISKPMSITTLDGAATIGN